MIHPLAPTNAFGTLPAQASAPSQRRAPVSPIQVGVVDKAPPARSTLSAPEGGRRSAIVCARPPFNAGRDNPHVAEAQARGLASEGQRTRRPAHCCDTIAFRALRSSDRPRCGRSLAWQSDRGGRDQRDDRSVAEAALRSATAETRKRSPTRCLVSAQSATVVAAAEMLVA